MEIVTNVGELFCQDRPVYQLAVFLTSTLYAWYAKQLNGFS